MSIYVNTYGKSNLNLSDGEISEMVKTLFDMRPKAIEKRLNLRMPIYFETAAYGHMGREPEKITKVFESRYNSEPKKVEVELFTWEKLDYVDKIKDVFGIN
jgi:S-adenosylmethionine synthetase